MNKSPNDEAQLVEKAGNLLATTRRIREVAGEMDFL
jgi:hypothetical protein